MTRWIVLLILFSFIMHSSAQRPNILWITAEDLSPRLACYGDSLAHTPNLNELAREGVVYTRAFSTYGVCAPSRHSIIMGMYPSSTGAGAMRTHVRTSAIKDITDPELLNIPVYEATPPVGAKCFTEYLRQAGYYCTNNSKTDYQFKPPLTAWDESNQTAHWRNRPDPDMPFFSVFNFEVTHESKIHNPPSPSVISPQDVLVPPYYPDTETVRNDIAHHYDNIVALDHQIGELLNQLKDDGLLDNTIIFFYGDHGDGLPRAKRWVYDSGIQIPLIIRFPDQKLAGSKNNELVSFVDFAPTILSLCQVKIPDHMEGQAFLGSGKSEERKYIYAFRDRMDPAFETIRAVRDKRFKYIRNYRPELPYIGFIPYRDRMLMMKEINKMIENGSLKKDQWQFYSKHKPLEELYDTKNDPHEIHNLASDPDYLDTLYTLRSALEDFQLSHIDLGMMPETELIKILWPPNGIQPKTDAPEIKITDGLINISCTSEGASIAYREQNSDHWKLYTRPFPPKKGTTYESQAIRLGWLPSDVSRKSY
ncbi:MAG: sulfatase-like hydrolase/transferase [Saprospiraceae bacterium]|nr:sulfatase-like hydrolase/transferase [Saprospiraceae bacterium]